MKEKAARQDVENISFSQDARGLHPTGIIEAGAGNLLRKQPISISFESAYTQYTRNSIQHTALIIKDYKYFNEQLIINKNVNLKIKKKTHVS